MVWILCFLIFFVIQVAQSAPHYFHFKNLKNQEKQFRVASKMLNSCFDNSGDIVQKPSTGDILTSSCSLPCNYIQDLSSADAFPFSWKFCPMEPLHFYSISNDPTANGNTAVHFKVPELMPSLTFGKKGLGKRSLYKTSDSSKDNIPVVTVETIPAPEYPVSGQSLPIGLTRLKYQGVITANDCFDDRHSKKLGLVDQYKQFKEMNLTLGDVPLTCEFSIIVHDAQPPVFTFCPGNREFQLKKHQSRIVFTYDKPIAVDNSRQKPYIYQSKGPRSGDRLGPGKHQIQFVAKDDEGNMAICEFHVKVIRFNEDDITQGRPPSLRFDNNSIFNTKNKRSS